MCSDETVSPYITPSYLMDMHDITREEATLLWQFSIAHTIRYKQCYGDGSIMFPMFKKALRESELAVKAMKDFLHK